MSNINNVVEIVFGNSLYSSMKKSKLNENDIILFNTLFSVSDLSTSSDYRLNINMDIGCYNDEYSFKDEMEKLKIHIKNGGKIRVWSSHKDIEPYLLLLFLSNEFKDSDVNLYVTFSEEFEKCPSPACLNPNELEKLSTMEHEVSKEEILEYSKVWEELVLINSPMRVIDKGQVLSENLDYFDNFILNLLEMRGSSKISRIAGEMLSTYHIQDSQIVYFIDELIKKGKIKIVEESKERHFLDIIDIV